MSSITPGRGDDVLIDRQTIYKGRVVKLTVDAVELPNGVHTSLEIVHHPGGAAIVAIDAAERVCLLRQYRYAAGGYVWELPAGKLEPNEPPLATAQRELAEEAAQHAGQWQSLGDYVSSPGVLTEVVHLFLATDLAPTASSPEASEVFEVHWWPLELARERALNNELRDGKSALGILRAFSLLEKP